MQTSTKHSVGVGPDLNHDNDNEHGNDGATTAPPPPPPQPDNNNNNNNNKGWGRVEQEKSAQMTRDASSGHFPHV